MSLYTLAYETSNRSHKEPPIIEKPVRFGFGKPYDLPQDNYDGRKQDNICIDCLNEEIEAFLRKKKIKQEQDSSRPLGKDIITQKH